MDSTLPWFGCADVVDLGDGGVAVLVEGDAAVGVEEVGLVPVDEVLDAAEVLELPAVRRDAAHRFCFLGEVGRLAGVVVVEIGEGGVGAVVGAPASGPVVWLVCAGASQS
jgi:hypothetical protein